MKIAVPAESDKAESRVATTPDTCKQYIKLGCEVAVEAGAGAGANISDADYREAGAKIVKSVKDLVKDADIVLTVRRPDAETVGAMKKGAVLVAMLDPWGDVKGMGAIAKTGVSAFSMEFMPRITRAQSMDVLSSQSNLAGYKAVIDAAAHYGGAFPMMMTAAGTVPPTKVFIMGVGVAGLQAIATARRLGAITTANDIRPETEEQVQSLGAKFIKVEGASQDEPSVYARELTDEEKAKQAEVVAEHVKKQDIVITTALIPGRPAPKLISKAMVESMKAGSIILDMAAERGGNCELTKPGKIVKHKGVTIMGELNLAGELPMNASNLYSRNLMTFIQTSMIDKESGKMAIDWEDELIAGTLITRDGEIVHPSLKEEDATS